MLCGRKYFWYKHLEQISRLTKQRVPTLWHCFLSAELFLSGINRTINRLYVLVASHGVRRDVGPGWLTRTESPSLVLPQAYPSFAWGCGGSAFSFATGVRAGRHWRVTRRATFQPSMAGKNLLLWGRRFFRTPAVPAFLDTLVKDPRRFSIKGAGDRLNTHHRATIARILRSVERSI